MGWVSDDGTHEGYLVGLVDDEENRERGSFLGHHPFRLRELGGSEDTTCRQLLCVKAACSCGWRSPLLRAPVGAEFFPSVVHAPQAFEDACCNLWKGHVIQTGRAPDGGCDVFELLRRLALIQPWRPR